MLLRALPLLALLSALPVHPITTPEKPTPTAPGGRVVGKAQCAARINARLEAMHRREAASSRAGLDLDGYSLHHALQHRGYDMYVTGMRVRVPARHGWFRVDRCTYDPANKTLEARLLFKDMSVSGLVRLYDGDLLGQDTAPRPLNACNMTLRFRKAGVGLTATAHKSARSPLEIMTRADFLEPNFVSVHGLGCSEAPRHAPTIEHRIGRRQDNARHGSTWGWPGNSRTTRDLRGRDSKDDGSESRELRRGQDTEEAEEPRWIEGRDLAAEVEDVFLRGVKTLLTSYMDKQLQPALSETLMANLGYTVSYG